ncbi:MAG TPA: hypothetical protein VK994_07850 [Bacteroidales bacterium]|nr:hypothetical protein [Bacteroidales bacterium]
MKAPIKKTVIAVVLLAFISSVGLMAQTEDKDQEVKKDRAEMFEKMKSAKIAFITERLQLTPAEAEKFWPLYNEFESKMTEITRDLFRRFEERPENMQPLSDEEAEKIIQQRFSEEKALLDLKKEYYVKYKEVLSPSKIFLLYESENNFRRHMLERMDRGKPERDQRQGGEGKPEREMSRPHPR